MVKRAMVYERSGLHPSIPKGKGEEMYCMPDIRHGLEARACARAHTSLDDTRVGYTASICEADSPKPIARGPWIGDSDWPRDAPYNHCDR
jgi:hypothetical protein